MNYLELYRSAYITIRLQQSPTKKEVHAFRALYICPASPNHFCYRLQGRGVIKLFRALQIYLHLQNVFSIAYKEGDFINYLEHYRSCLRLQKFLVSPTKEGVFINYLELYRSAYITLRLQHRLQRRESITHLEIQRSAYISNPFLLSPAKEGDL